MAEPRGLSGAVIQRSVVSDPTQAIDAAMQNRAIAKRQSQEELNNLYEQFNIEEPEGLNQNYREGFFKIKEEVYEPALAKVVATRGGDPRERQRAVAELKDVKEALKEYVLGSKERMKRAKLNYQTGKTKAASNFLTQEGNQGSLDEFNSMLSELDGNPVPDKIKYENGQLMVGDTPWRDYANYGRIIIPEEEEQYDLPEAWNDIFEPQKYGTKEGSNIYDAAKMRQQINLTKGTARSNRNFEEWVLNFTPATTKEEAEAFIKNNPDGLWKDYVEWGVEFGKTQVGESAGDRNNQGGGNFSKIKDKVRPFSTEYKPFGGEAVETGKEAFTVTRGVTLPLGVNMYVAKTNGAEETKAEVVSIFEGMDGRMYADVKYEFEKEPTGGTTIPLDDKRKNRIAIELGLPSGKGLEDLLPAPSESAVEVSSVDDIF